MYKWSHIISKCWKVSKLPAKGTLYIGIAAAVALALIILVKCLSAKDAEHREIVLQDTPIEIEEVRMKGEIYVCSAIMEDFVSVHKTEKHLGVIPERHSCVQIIRQKCSYKIDLDKVTYQCDSNKVVYVHIPQPEYTASTQNTPFMSDDEEYWIDAMPNTNALKQKVERKIRKRFDTAENRRKAIRYAEDAISDMLEKLGYQAEFISTIEQKRD